MLDSVAARYTHKSQELLESVTQKIAATQVSNSRNGNGKVSRWILKKILP